MADYAETIYLRSRQLPEDAAREVLDFIDFLLHRGSVAAAPDRGGEADAIELDPQRRHELVERLRQLNVSWDGSKPMPNRDALYDEARGSVR